MSERTPAFDGPHEAPWIVLCVQQLDTCHQRAWREAMLFVRVIAVSSFMSSSGTCERVGQRVVTYELSVTSSARCWRVNSSPALGPSSTMVGSQSSRRLLVGPLCDPRSSRYGWSRAGGRYL